jgi:serine/threonine protein phosphatase 1
VKLLPFIFWRQAKPRSADASSGDRIVYAIGDIHGRSDQLERIIRQISDDAGRLAPDSKPALVFLGDYIDRGPDSRGAIDRVLALRAAAQFEVRTLKGNHEAAMLAFMEDPELGPAWTEHGGAQTLASYGVAPPMRRTDAAEWKRARDQLLERLPAAHKSFLLKLELVAIYGDYAFVHAGVRPGVPIMEQRERDLLWIREPFLSHPRPFEKVVVHGHTPNVEPFLGHNRIGIDTGAYATGVLTGLRLEGATRTIIQAVAAGAPP